MSEIIKVIEGCVHPAGFNRRPMTGCKLVMSEGPAWFHPYCGAQPVRWDSREGFARVPPQA